MKIINNKFWYAVLALILFQVCSLKAQGDWELLSKVSFKKMMDENMGFEVDFPLFSKDLQSRENTLVELRGFIIPTDGYKNQQEFVFSQFPYKNCFFCGGAGPETVIEVHTLNPILYTSEKITLRGKLKLNRSDLNRLMFQLSNAEKIDP